MKNYIQLLTAAAEAQTRKQATLVLKELKRLNKKRKKRLKKQRKLDASKNTTRPS